jgi:hypothetical protein
MKKLQEDSKFNQFDADGDGVVTDDELARSERMIQIENNDKMQDQQRLMAWVAMWSTIVAIAALLSPLVALDRVDMAWICGLALFWSFILQPFLVFFLLVFGVDLPPLPEVGTADLMPILLGMLGLGGLRSYEKIQKVTK